MKPRLAQLFREYAASHRHPTNRLTHKIAIPLIVFHIMAMLDWIKLPVNLPFEIGGATIPLSVGHISYLATVAYYGLLHIPLALIMAVVMLPLFYIAQFTPWYVVVVVAVIGWVVQLAGHSVWEKNRPAFLKNMQQALIGPLYFVAVMLGFYKPVYSAPARAEA